MSQRRQEARGVTTWWRRYRGRPAVQVGLAFTVGLAAFALAALVSPHLRGLDGDAVFVLGIFILMAVPGTKNAAPGGRRGGGIEQAQRPPFPKPEAGRRGPGPSVAAWRECW